MSDGITDMMIEQENKDALIEELKIKVKEANKFIKGIAKLLKIETDGLGYDGLELSLDDFKEAING